MKLLSKIKDLYLANKETPARFELHKGFDFETANKKACSVSLVRSSDNAVFHTFLWSPYQGDDHLHSARAKIKGGVLIDLTSLDKKDLTDWAGEYGLLHLFKAADEDLYSDSSRGEFAYEIGSTVKPLRWSDNHSCGDGSPTPQHALSHFAEATRFLECTCDPKDFRPINWSKGKCPEAVVLREVDINGVPVVAS